jgi:hypothetical protein
MCLQPTSLQTFSFGTAAAPALPWAPLFLPSWSFPFPGLLAPFLPLACFFVGPMFCPLGSLSLFSSPSPLCVLWFPLVFASPGGVLGWCYAVTCLFARKLLIFGSSCQEQSSDSNELMECNWMPCPFVDSSSYLHQWTARHHGGNSAMPGR